MMAGRPGEMQNEYNTKRIHNGHDKNGQNGQLITLTGERVSIANQIPGHSTVSKDVLLLMKRSVVINVAVAERQHISCCF